MKKKILRIALWVGIIISVFVIIIFFLGLFADDIQSYLDKKRDENIMAFAEQQRAKYLELQMADNYGGKTPEETLDLYINALKVGDIELASKYSEISLENPYLQEGDLKKLEEMIKRDGNLNILLENMNNIIKKGVKKIWTSTKVSFVYDYIITEQSTSTSIISGQEVLTVRPKGLKESLGISLELNPYTKVWKIIQ